MSLISRRGSINTGSVDSRPGIQNRGFWNADTNVTTDSSFPSLASGIGTKNYYYVVSVAGTTDLDGIAEWEPNDWALFDGTVWEKIDNSESGSGDVTGPASSVDDNIATYNLTSGKIIKDGGTSVSAINTAIALKAPLASPPLTGTVSIDAKASLSINGTDDLVIGVDGTDRITIDKTDKKVIINDGLRIENHDAGNQAIVEFRHVDGGAGVDAYMVSRASDDRLRIVNAQNSDVTIEANSGTVASFSNSVAPIATFEGLVETDSFKMATGASAGYVMKTDASGNGTWQAGGGSTGDVTGPASSVDSNVALFDGTTGKIIKDGGALGALAALNSVSAAEIDSGAVDTDELASDAVTTPKILDGDVTDAKLGTGIDAAKIGAGNVSNTEFGYLNGASSSLQTQITSNATNIATKAGSGANSDITSISGLTTALSVAQGGTGGTTTTDARSNLGLGSLATQSSVTDTDIAAGVNADKIANGTVSNTEFEYINSLTSNAQTQFDAKAPLASPALTGSPTAPTQSAGDDSTKIATTAYVDSQASPNNKGFYATPAALRTAYPTGQDGWYAIVGSTDTFWVWDTTTTDWVDSSAGAAGTVTSIGITGGTGVTSSGGPVTTSGSITVDLDSATQTSLAQVATNTTDIANNTSSIGANTTAIATKITASSSDTLTNKTFDVDNNTLSNVEVDNLKAGVLDTDLASVSASDDTLASAKAIKTYVDATAGGVGTVTSVDVTAGTGITSAGGPVTTSGSITVGLDSATQTSLAQVATNTTAIATKISASSTDTLTNKTIDADGTGNNISNIEDANIKAAAAIDASKLADGTVSNTELQYINSLTSNAQTQLDAKGVGTVTSITAGTGLDGGVITGSGTIDLADTAVTAGAYTSADITIDAQGRITVAANGSGGGSGDVTGPSSSTDTNIATFDGITGKIIQDGGITTASISSAISQTTTNTTNIATNTTAIATKAPLASPALTGSPTAPTQSAGDDSTKIATTAYVDTATTTRDQLSELTDVTITSITDADYLVYDATSAVWENQAISGAITSDKDGVTTLASGIDATKLADGTITNTELQYINSLSSNAQTQLDTKISASSTDTLTNKTIDADGTGNSITNIEDANIKAAAAIDATKLADGSVTNTELEYINSVTSNVQTQLDSVLGTASANAVNISNNTSAIALKAALASPTFTGTVTIPTLSATSTQTTNFQLGTSTTAGYVIKADASGNGTWQADSTGSGDVAGPGSSTNNNVAAFDGTTGKIIKDSGKTLDDIGRVILQRFTSSGTGNVTAPTGALAARITAYGGGGGGAGGGYSFFDSTEDSYIGGGGGGGSSSEKSEVLVGVTGGSTVIYYDIGTGGTAGAGQTLSVTAGAGGYGNSTMVGIDSTLMRLLLSGYGGAGGSAPTGSGSGSLPDGGDGGGGLNYEFGGGGGNRGLDGFSDGMFGTGGSGSIMSGETATSGTGGAGGYQTANGGSEGGGGGGANGGSGASDGVGSSGSLASGGGGGSGGNSSGSLALGRAGGAGGDGYISIEWQY